MKAVYILNESNFYLRLAWISMATLRRFNCEIPLEVVLVMDGGRENRDINNWYEMNMGIPWFTAAQFAEECALRFGARVTVVENPDVGEEAGYVSIHRKELWRVSGEDILLLDADTFILDDISPLWSGDPSVMVTADRNEWGNANGPIPGGYEAFNSGVVLFRGDSMQRYARRLYELSLAIKHDTHPLGPWLGHVENILHNQPPDTKPRKGSREELAFSVWVKEDGISYRFWDRSEVQTCRLGGHTRVLHTMTQNWVRHFTRFFKHGIFMPPRRMRRVLMPIN